MKATKALIALEDGAVFEGKSCGIEGEKEGEIVFNTSMTGYQEIMTDPSYKGQIVTMTYPLIGNYGVNEDDTESGSPKVEGFIVRELSRIASNHRSQDNIVNYLKNHNIVAIEEVDTRALTRHIRVRGAMKGIISTIDADPESLIKKARTSKGIVGRDLVKEVTCREPYIWSNTEEDRGSQFKVQIPDASRLSSLGGGFTLKGSENSKLEILNSKLKVVVMDFGVKMNILRMLNKAGCHVAVVPANTSAEDILAMQADGVLLSNGPGDPEGVPYAIEEIKKLIGKIPIFGICLGQQLLGLAYGGKTYKLKFGHRGANQPIKDLTTGKVYIVSENHGFAVDIDSIKTEPVKATHVNLNDNTIEGLEHETYPVFSVQYHPEASPGPHDAYGLFAKFADMMEKFRDKRTMS
ncbi:MAG: glutamine-hydrolyzing carbamoyl-phosphate synthase small subunit [Proteobacteria bacterium]|nr:glutamine-hydrolyzing carbamoyl-phosphate synthase small subunit [Pseudomonadota bacterium]